MKTTTLIFCAFYALLFSMPTQSFAQSGSQGGGDVCEERIRDIVKDISTWVTAGGASAFDFKGLISESEYDGKMLSYLIPMVAKESHSVLVECTSDKVSVNGVEKMCKWDDRGPRAKITCNTEAFLKLTDGEQYRLTHHEVASIARIETNNGAISDYFLSDQIIDSLEPQIILRLVVRSKNNRAEVIKSMSLLNEHLKKVTISLLAPEKSDLNGFDDFLKQPDTGIMRIFPRRNSAILDGIINGGGSYYSFATRTNEYGYGSDLEYKAGDNKFAVGFAGVDYGFMASLGNLDIRVLDLSQKAILAALSHRPPNGQPEPAWRAEQHATYPLHGRTINGVIFDTPVEAVVGQTYILRSIVEGTSDVAVVFQVLRKDSVDGSLIIAWKIVQRFEIPRMKRD